MHCWDKFSNGTYRIQRLLGEGGMGAVYEATQVRLNKRVAVKVMARELTANPEALARFRREAEVTSGLGHPHIVQVFDFGATPTGEPFLAMEYLDGEDLEHRGPIEPRGCIPHWRCIFGGNAKQSQPLRPAN